MNRTKLSSELQAKVVAVIRAIQREIRWKPGKDLKHLATRKEWKHLHESATLDDYHTIIQTVVWDENAQVYLYHYGITIYPTIVARLNQIPWLVMVGLNGIMETAFVIEEPEEYLNKREFELLGTLKEVLS